MICLIGWEFKLRIFPPYTYFPSDREKTRNHVTGENQEAREKLLIQTSNCGDLLDGFSPLFLALRPWERDFLTLTNTAVVSIFSHIIDSYFLKNSLLFKPTITVHLYTRTHLSNMTLIVFRILDSRGTKEHVR